MISSVDLTQGSIERLPKIGHKNFSDWSAKRGKRMKKTQNQTEPPGTVDNFKKYSIHVTGIPEKSKNKAEEIFEGRMVKNFPK